MAKGVAIRFISYGETIPKLLKLIRFDNELKKHSLIVLKPSILKDFPENSTRPEFLEQIVKFCMVHKNPAAEIFIAEGCNGADTAELFEEGGYSKIAEKYSIGLVDLNHTETIEIESSEFLRLESIKYPKILLDSFLISVPHLTNDNNIGISASLSNMLGAYPSKHYKGFFSQTKNKLNKYPFKYQIHDILKCKLPDFAVIDASEKGAIISGKPIEMDKQSAKAAGLDWRSIPYLKLIHESFTENPPEENIESLIDNS